MLFPAARGEPRKEPPELLKEPPALPDSFARCLSRLVGFFLSKREGDDDDDDDAPL